MNEKQSAMVEFFAEFERSVAEGTGGTALFAEAFLAGGPNGARCIAKEDFARALPKRKEALEGLGLRGSELAGMTETALDDRYTMVRTRWRMHFERASGGRETVELESSFLVDTGGEAPRILAYLAHQDVFAVAAAIQDQAVNCGKGPVEERRREADGR